MLCVVLLVLLAQSGCAMHPAARDRALTDPEAKHPVPIDRVAMDPETANPASMDPPNKDPVSAHPVPMDRAAKEPEIADPASKDHAEKDTEIAHPASMDRPAKDPDFAHPASMDHASKDNSIVDPLFNAPPPQLTNTNTNSNTSQDVIAFSAQLSQDKEILGDNTIIFDQTLTNIGDRYFNNTGQFACADTGLYVFIWSLMKAAVTDMEGMRCHSKLRKGQTDQKFGPKTSYYNTGVSGVAEMTAVLQCTTSPLTTITVMTIPWSEEIGRSSVYYRQYTSFSGFKLSENIAFTVELSETQKLNAGSRLRFERVVSNIGNHYDDINHAFRCPDDGLYVVSVATYSQDSTVPWSVSRLMIDRDVILRGPITYRATSIYDSGTASATAVVQCNSGASIFVDAQPSHHFPYNIYGPDLTGFMGFKLYDVGPGAVAFTAVMSQNHTVEYDTEPFPFDQVITNVGEAFDATQGEFTCPDDDFYLFTWTTVADYGGDLSSTYLYMGMMAIKQNYLTNQTPDAESGTSGSSSMSVVRQCRQGDKVYVSGRGHARVFLGGYNSFSGYKLPGF